MSGGRGAQIVVSVCGRTDRGQVRKENQDSFLILDLAGSAADASVDTATVSFPLGEGGAVLLVADGMGGRAGGARASAMAVNAVREAMVSGNGAFPPRMRRALELANEAIHEESRRDDELRGMGTTATLAGISGDIVYFAQVGDSRGYLARRSVLARVTRDQSLVQDLIDSGIVDEAGARNIKDNRILQALGPATSVLPEMTYHELRRGDVLLLCSDGLSRVVSDDEILANIEDGGDCSAVCERLIALANARGGPDNITVLAARLEGDGLPPSEGADTPARKVYAEPGE